MKARLTVSMAGIDFVRHHGDIVEGENAVRLLAAGFAEPIVEEETASLKPPVEKAVRAKKSVTKPE